MIYLEIKFIIFIQLIHPFSVPFSGNVPCRHASVPYGGRLRAAEDARVRPKASKHVLCNDAGGSQRFLCLIGILVQNLRILMKSAFCTSKFYILPSKISNFGQFWSCLLKN